MSITQGGYGKRLRPAVFMVELPVATATVIRGKFGLHCTVVQTSYHFLTLRIKLRIYEDLRTRSVAPVSELDHAIWRALVLKPELPTRNGPTRRTA
jgi:hypothetical protein